MARLPANAPIVTAAVMRDAERRMFEGGTSQAELMQRAGRAVAEAVRRFAVGRSALFLAGPGNNGGDAFVAATFCRDWGMDVRVACHGRHPAGVAGEMRARWGGPTASIEAADPCPVLVDGLFGTGLSRPLDPAVAQAAGRFAAHAAFTLAIDVPSGCDADAHANFRTPMPADVTLALGALKPAHVTDPSVGDCGTVLLADIGVAVPDRWRTLARPRIAAPGRTAHKYDRGLVAVIGGAMPGAARLAAGAAISAGAGYVILAASGGDGGALPDAVVRRDFDDEVLSDDRTAAVLIGPGLGRDERAQALLDRALASSRTLVLDGDALTLMGNGVVDRVSGRTAPTILTPHAGEFARMFGEGKGSKIERTVAASARCHATVVHKGADTVIARPDGSVRVKSDASSWLSTAGTGDVLAGAIAARLAVAGEGGVEEGVWLHARAASIAGPAFPADRLIPALSEAIAQAR